jgi:hypothetical protein
MSEMTKESATEFFAEFFGGEHHFPDELKPWGPGWCIKSDQRDFSTYDYDGLTRLVLMAHDRCVRVEIIPCGKRLQIAIHQRHAREGRMTERHPTIEMALARWRETHP